MSDDGPYTKIKDSWYLGPTTWQLPDGLYHLHAVRGAGLNLQFDVVWRMDKLRDFHDGDSVIDGLGTVRGNGVPIYGCNCGAIAPDDVVGKFLINRRAAVEHSRNNDDQET